MADKRMLILPLDIIKKIDENRGDLSQAEFINFLIDNQLKNNITEKQAASREEILALVESQLKEVAKKQHFTTREDMQAFEQDIKVLLKSCLDFFVSYGLELGKNSPDEEFQELTNKLGELENHLNSEGESKEAKIKWK
jgi:polyhydroxyalkanoate synthesis regulator phasin